MLFTSTRNSDLRAKGSEVVLTGLAPDGGLYVPETIPELSAEEIDRMCGMEYYERAGYIMSKFFDELTLSELTQIAKRAYDTFDGDPAPLVKVDSNLSFLELYHGKTHAFKDMALSVLPLLMTALKKKAGQNEICLIPVATSGDTGKAALEGFSDVEGTAVFVFYPYGGVSSTQRLQMITTLGSNVRVAAIKGNFDDAQTAVKACFTSADLIKRLKKANAKLTGANSINFGRLAPQIAYYISAYVDLVASEQIKNGDKVDFTVPTGNFGNILAAYYAKKMGLPVGKLVCASNENNVLTDFINSGVYCSDREFIKTTSPSMDILISSNLERYLFELAGRNSATVKTWMASLKAEKRYDIGKENLEKMHEDFACGYATEEDVKNAVSYLFEEYGYLADPHTAVGYAVGAGETGDNQMVIVSTASPVKFAKTVLSFIGEKVPESDEKALKVLAEKTAFEVPESVKNLFKMEERFTSCINACDVPEEIEKFADSIKG